MGISTREWGHLHSGIWGSFWGIGYSGITPSANAQKSLSSLHCLFFFFFFIRRLRYKPDICRKPTDKVKYVQRELLNNKILLKILLISSEIFRNILHPYKMHSFFFKSWMLWKRYISDNKSAHGNYNAIFEINFKIYF